jgi:hypothetical protein
MKQVIKCDLCPFTLDIGMGSMMAIHELLHHNKEVKDGNDQIWTKDNFPFPPQKEITDKEVNKDYLESLERDHRQLKFAVEVVLYHTVAGSNGGYYSQFGPIAFTTMVKITGFNLNNREINEKRDG